MVIDNKIEDHILDVAVKLTADIRAVAEHMVEYLKCTDVPRCCTCGADKGIVGLYTIEPMMVVPVIRSIARRVLHEEWDANDGRVIGVYGYLIGKYPLEPCDEGCQHADRW